MTECNADNRWRCKRLRWWAVACALTLACGGAAAQESDAETTAAARSLAVQGVKLARVGDCAQAIEPLIRAQALRHSSVVLTELGVCYLQLGRLVAGSEALRRVVREGLPESPSPAQRDALTRAERLLAEVLSKIAQLTLIVTGPRAEEVALSIDGQSVPVALYGAPRPTDPGVRRMVASAPGFLPVQLDVELSEGESRRLEVPLAPAPESVATRFAPSDLEPSLGRPPEAASPRDTSSTGRPLRRAAYAAAGLGAEGVATGVLFGGLFWSDKRGLEQRCGGNFCPESESSEIVQAKRYRLVSTIGFAVGAAGLVAGSIVYSFARRRERRASAAWSAGLTLTGGAVRARF
jgi:hypothetical protein